MFDYTVELAPGAHDEKREVSSSLTWVGGTAANAAAGLATLGVPVAVAATLGEDCAGAFCLDELVARGVDVGLVRRRVGATGRATIVIDGGHRSVLVDRGVSETVLDDLPGFEVLYASGPAVLGGRVPSCGRLVLGLEQQMVGPAIEPLLARADLVVTNDLGWTALRDLDPAAPVVETRGAEGTVIHRRGRPSTPVAPVPAGVVDATGAGDAFAAGLVAALAAGAPLDAAVAFANRLGAVAVQQRGAMLTGVPENLRAAFSRLRSEPGRDWQ